MRKQRVQKVLDAFPDDVNVDEFIEKVYLLQKIEAGERQIEVGETVSHEGAKMRLKEWLAYSGRQMRVIGRRVGVL